MPSWTKEFAFGVGDRVAVSPPPESDDQWMKYAGRYGTVGRIVMEAGDNEPETYVRYRIDLESAPRGKGHILWCRETHIRTARKGVPGAQ